MDERYRVGGLYRLIDEQGTDRGLCVLMGLHEPWTLDERPGGSFGMWNFSLLVGDRCGYYNTSLWTLVPADCL